MNHLSIFKFRLFVAGSSQNSMQAVANLNSICSGCLPGRYEIEVIDVFEQPLMALNDAVYMTPTLIKLGPLPIQRIVGALSQPDVVLQTFGIGAAVT